MEDEVGQEKSRIRRKKATKPIHQSPVFVNKHKKWLDETFSDDSGKSTRRNINYFLTSSGYVDRCKVPVRDEAYTFHPIAASIAVFNKRSNSNLSYQISDTVTNSVAENSKSLKDHCKENGVIKEEIFEEPSRKDVIENCTNTEIKKLHDKAVEPLCEVEQVHRSVSSCNLPIEINLLQKTENVSLYIQSIPNPHSTGNIKTALNKLESVTAVCFDLPPSSSNVNIEFENVSLKRPNTN